MLNNHRLPSDRQWWLDVIKQSSKIIRDLAVAIKAILELFQ